MVEVIGIATAQEVWLALESAYSHDSVERMQNLIDSFPQLQKVEGHELFIKSVYGSSSSSPATVAFVAESGRSSSSSGHGFSPRSGRGGRSGGRGRGHRPPHCQLYRQTGHYADKCPDLYTFANRGYSLDANLAQAFHAKCGVYDDSSYWFVDSGASTHMTSSSASLDSTMPYTGSDHVTVSNGNNRHTKDILAKGRYENGLYVLTQGHKALVVASHMPSHAQPPTNTYPMTTRAKPKGYKSAAKNSKWITAIKEEMAALKHNDIQADTSLFVFQREKCLLYLLVYVDDIILTGNNNVLISRFISRLNKEFAIKDLAKYAHDILSRAGFLNSKSVSTPLSTYANLTINGDLFSYPTLYRSLVGGLQYLTITRPDLSYAVNQVSQFLHAPTNDHFQAVKLILRYVKGTMTFGLAFNRSPRASLTTFSFLMLIARFVLIRGVPHMASEVVWLTSLLRELQVPLPSIPVLYCDNKSAIFLSQNPVAHKRAKHIDIDYHFVRELVSHKKLSTRFVPSSQQLADIFTKSLPRPLFESFRSKLCVGPPPPRLRGGIGDISSEDCK
ncbi:uncharacterized mitochondrial protein-like protein [Tanacetum coccineum]